jgi:hypothetical protein
VEDRLVQTGVENMVAARGINPIIRRYLQRDPELGPVLLQDPAGGDRTVDDFYGPVIPRRLVFTTASMVGAVTSILLGVVAGLAAVGRFGKGVGLGVGAGVALLKPLTCATRVGSGNSWTTLRESRYGCVFRPSNPAELRSTGSLRCRVGAIAPASTQSASQRASSPRILVPGFHWRSILSECAAATPAWTSLASEPR